MEPEMEGKEREVEEFARELGINAQVIRFSKAVRTVADVEKLGIDAKSVVKTLIAKANGRYYAAIVRGDQKLNLKKLARVVGASSAKMASPEEILKITGVPAGAVSPILPYIRDITVVVDKRVYELDEAYGGGGSAKALVMFSPREYVEKTGAMVADIAK